MEKKLMMAILTSLIVVFILVIVSFKYWNSDSESSEKRGLFQKENGIVVNIWTEGKNLDIIRKHGLKYLIVDVGDTGQDGKLLTSEGEIKEFLDKAEKFEKENNYEFIMLPYSEVNTHDYKFNKEFQDNFIENYLRLVEMGFDGVYVDVEPVRDGRDYLEFLDKVRKEFSFVGVYSGAVGSHSDNEWEWDLDFYKQVCKKVDLIFVPGYDTGIINKEEYVDFIEMEVSELSKLGLSCDLMLGVPTHYESPEILENALEGYGDGGRFVGVGVFAEWTMDKKEWGVFEGFVR